VARVGAGSHDERSSRRGLLEGFRPGRIFELDEPTANRKTDLPWLPLQMQRFFAPARQQGGRMPTNRRSDSRFPEVPMRRRPAVTILMFIVAVILTLPLRAQQTPFTEVQVSNMVRAGLRDEERVAQSLCSSNSAALKLGSPSHLCNTIN